jgi:hyperosmotically inducible periplasmic protein
MDLPDDGIVLSENGASHNMPSKFIAAMAKHRNWQREKNAARGLAAGISAHPQVGVRREASLVNLPRRDFQSVAGMRYRLESVQIQEESGERPSECSQIKNPPAPSDVVGVCLRRLKKQPFERGYMTINSIRWLGLAVLLLVVTACSVSADKEQNKLSAPAADADNTARNDRDSSGATKTPLDQGQNAQDIEISANIRKAILEDDSLSSNAHNVKIITSGGTVTLRGPVKSTQEKAAIESKARQVAGVTRVDSFLEIEAGR